MRQALDGYAFDYYSDTAYSAAHSIHLADLLDYGLVIIGAESAGSDDIGAKPSSGGILDDVCYYLSIGGKVIIFTRGGTLTPAVDELLDTVDFLPDSDNYHYLDYFNMERRLIPPTTIDSNGGKFYLVSDLVGARSSVMGYPDLVWDSLASLAHVNHSGASFAGLSGIPGPSFPDLGVLPVEVLYSYDSSTDSVLTENRPMAWRSLDGPGEYVYFSLPLSFMNPEGAVAALRQAITDLGITTSAEYEDEGTPVPDRFLLSQNYPNPFNPATTIEFRNAQARPVWAIVTVFNILGQRVRTVYDDLAQPGLTRAGWDGRDETGAAVASGIYLYRLRIDAFTLTRKMILLR